MKKIVNYSISSLLALSFVLFSCKKTELEDVQTVYFPDEYSFKCDTSTIFSGTEICADMYIEDDDFTGYEAFKYLKEHSKENQDVNIRVYEGSVSDAVSGDRDLYTVVYPDVEKLNRWGRENGLDIDFTPYEGYSVVAFDLMGNICTVASFIEDDILGSLNAYVDWVNDYMIHDTDSEIASNGLLSWNLSDYDKTYNKWYGSHTIPFKITDYIFAEVACSKKDKRSGNGYIEFRWNVRPLHAFNGTLSAGDYYLVSVETNLASRGMYDADPDHYDITHGGVHVRNRGFYAKNVDFTTKICKCTSNDGKFNPANMVQIGQFVQIPKPETTRGSTTYGRGINITLSCDLTGGFKQSGNLDFGAVINGGLSLGDSEQRTISDLDILNNSVGNTSEYGLQFNNGPRMPGGLIKITEPTSVQVSNATLEQGFVMYVPEAKDNDTTRYYINFNLTNLVYGICRFYTTRADFKEFTPNMSNFTSDGKPLSSVASVYFRMPYANRSPLGSVTITHDDEASNLFSIEFTDVDTPSRKYVYNGVTYKESECFEKSIPCATYSVKVKMGENRADAKEYVSIDSIKVKASEPVKMYTKSDFKLVEEPQKNK